MACSFSIRLAAAVMLLPLFASSGAMAAQNFSGDYSVTYLGLPIARAAIKSTYEKSNYSISGAVTSAGLGRIFDDTKGTLRATGKIMNEGPVSHSFRAEYVSAKKPSLVDIRFANGTVVSTQVKPAPKKRGKDWVALQEAHLRAAIDPIASTMVRADSIDHVCGRTVKMYDGEIRADLKLSRVSMGTVSVKGYKGPTVTCRMNFQPVSGYRKGKKSLNYLKDRSRIMVTFAPVGQTGIYAPIRATIGTQIGTITISASRFEASK
ncbi:DUF3108 domain-containing protein [Aquamicrobium segne]|uniref:DUF3108 domain-containing protein n=1 Tax=Aquamicrobium segne TaxID=469547 RepID=A0ABW0GXQ1_9HYPH